MVWCGEFYLCCVFVVRYIAFVSFLVLGSLRVCGQDPYYVSINKLSGMPSNAVYDLFQDSKGFIWIANNEGLTRYDGFEFKTYTNQAQTSRSGNQVEEDKYGRIWYKNFDGYLYYVEHDSLKSLKQNVSIGNAGYAILDDRLVVLQKNGVDFYDLKSLQPISSIKIVLNGLMTQEHYRQKYYLNLNDTLCTITKNGKVTFEKMGAAGLMCGSLRGIVIVEKGSQGKWCYEYAGGKLHNKIATTGVGYVHELEYCDEKYWMSTPEGVWVFDEYGKNINGSSPFFPDRSISSVLKDREGNFWLGTLNEGVLFVPDLRAKLASTHNFVPNILSSVQGKVLIGTKNNELYTYDIKSNVFALKYKGNLRHEFISFLADTINHKYSFCVDQFYITDTAFKITTSGGVSVKDIVIVDNKYYALATNGDISLVRIRQDLVSDFDSLFDAFYKNTPRRFNIDFASVITSCRGRTVAYNNLNGTLYGGTSKGLYAIMPHSITPITYEGRELYSRRLVSFRDKVYVVTPQNELFVVDSKNVAAKLSLVEEKEQCFNAKKANENLYLLTSNGMRILDPNTGKVNILNSHPGIRTEEINDMQVIADKLVFSSERGLIIVDANAAAKDTVNPRFVINSVLVNGKPAPNDMTFSHKENDIEINYSILSFNTDKRYRLSYKINNGNWQPNSGVTRTLKLASLSPGTYKISFRLESVNVSGYFAQQDINFTIKKPFWAEWWFLGGVLISLLSCSYAYYKWQTRLLKKQNDLKIEKVELERNLRNSMLTSIRSQMNPHFFYNALNAIQSFMFSDDKRNASTYLVKLSKLTRMILEMSEKENITLDEETEALKLYLELEKMRFSADFNYELHIDYNVDTELVKIPPMIVQPYVENAVKHGLLHKKGNKYLSISFKRSDDSLIIIIDDNGIGRERANERNQLKNEKHSSFSTEANSKRIELLNKGRRKNIGVVYIDKVENNIAIGTTVIITIPLT